ncbi:Serine/threonine-protein kinase PRP4 like [Quillaja saponaria]|uniref:Serine/threonine-protein kinase PRP4 like n=1 Tax=Quillaja saponaria TaxID=32244 RepID=A0AAD7P5U9_QUISA|nr:Serine/threonine-protein kinase PRP4 like [Quillaja saponaria]
MAANANANDSHRKHRRSSSPDESEKSAKRHKHCHHHRRHRHGSKKHAEESKHGAEIVAASPSKNPLPDSGINRYRPDDDVEEGEILEEEAFGGDDGRIGKKQVDYDGNSSEIKLSGASDHESEKRNPVCYD